MMRHLFKTTLGHRVGGVFARGTAIGFLALAAAIVPVFPGAVGALASPFQEAAVAQKKTVYLGPKFVEGRVTVYEQHSSMESSQKQLDADGQPQGEFGGSTKSTLVMRVRIAEVHEDGSATVEMTYDRFKTEGGGDLSAAYSFDSDVDPSEDANARVGRAFRTLLTMKVVAEVGADGIVHSVTGSEAAAMEISRVDEIQGRANEFQPASLMQMMQSFWRIGDEKREREEGEKWVEQQEMPLGGLGSLFFISTFDVAEVTDETSLIDFNLDLVLEVGEEFMLKEDAEGDESGSEADTEDESGDSKPAGGDGVMQEQDGDDGHEGHDHGDADGGQDSDTDEDAHDEDGQDDDGADDAEPMDMEPQYIPIEDAHLEVKDLPGHFLWDCERSELIERETALWFELTTVQAGLFQLRLTTIQRNDVKTSLKRIAVE
ncbi:MAG: hypothetical protein HND57_04140 [Planctomycetes bacterium]|nr:hypothetical protein [Planctomycetota bacterium]